MKKLPDEKQRMPGSAFAPRTPEEQKNDRSSWIAFLFFMSMLGAGLIMAIVALILM